MTFTQTDFSAPAQAGDAPLTRPQVAALCWRLHRGKVQVLLITSRETRRWIIPKGWPMDGRTAAEAATLEAWEEAGVTGQTDTTCFGQFSYLKLHPAKTAITCEVAVYPLRVAKLAAHFPEEGQRRRKWFSATKAARAVAEADLAEMIRKAARKLAPASKSEKT